MTFSILINIVSIAALSVYLACIIHSSVKTELINYYIALHCLTIIALMVDFFALLAPDSFQHIFMALSSIAGLLCSVSFLCFAICFMKEKGPGRLAVIVLYLFPIVCLTAALLSEPSLILKQGGGSVESGPLYKLYSGMEYLLRMMSGILLIEGLTKRMRKSPFEIFVVVIALISFTLKFIHSLNRPHYLAGIGSIAVLFLFSLLFFGYGKLVVFNTMSLGIRSSLELYNEAVFIMNSKGEKIYCNPACARMNQEAFSEVLNNCYLKIKAINLSVQGGRTLQVEHDQGMLTVSVRPARALFQNMPVFICAIHDDTILKTTINDLKEKNEELVEMNKSIKRLQHQTSHLAVVEERNMLAKEIHDVMGHSLNLALHTLESNKLILDEQPQKAIERLRQVVSDIDRGIDEIAAQKEVSQAKNNASLLKSLLTEMANRMAEVKVKMDVIYSCKRGILTDELAKIIYRICQEAITNATKHGKADQITVSIKEKSGVIHTYIIDNGIGCKELTKGNGLKGMEERIKSVGGSIYFNSFEDDDGFMVHASIPL